MLLRPVHQSHPNHRTGILSLHHQITLSCTHLQGVGALLGQLAVCQVSGKTDEALLSFSQLEDHYEFFTRTLLGVYSAPVHQTCHSSDDVMLMMTSQEVYPMISPAYCWSLSVAPRTIQNTQRTGRQCSYIGVFGEFL